MLINIYVFLIVFICCIFGLVIYIQIALRNKITSIPNNRNLHYGEKPTGGGVVFSAVFYLSCLYFWLTGLLNNEIFFVFGIGGLLATMFGLLDDLFDIN